MRELPIEHRWIEGKITVLPPRVSPPPDWAVVAAKLAWEKAFSHAFQNLSPEAIRKDPRGSVRELQGIYESLVGYVNHPFPEFTAVEEQVPELQELQKTVRRTVGKKFLNHLRSLDGRLEKLLPEATQERVIELGERYTRGARAATVEDGFLGFKTIAAKIYYLVWFFWPEMAQWRSFTAKDLETWLANSLAFRTSIKTVEAAHTDLRIATLWKPPST